MEGRQKAEEAPREKSTRTVGTQTYSEEAAQKIESVMKAPGKEESAEEMMKVIALEWPEEVFRCTRVRDECTPGNWNEEVLVVVTDPSREDAGGIVKQLYNRQEEQKELAKTKEVDYIEETYKTKTSISEAREKISRIYVVLTGTEKAFPSGQRYEIIYKRLKKLRDFMK